MQGAALELIAVTKRFGATLAVDAVSLRIEPGTYCCLLGPSGCGKTSTLRAVAGHESVTSGEIVLGATNITRMPPAKRGTAMMFQSYALFPHLSVLDNVAFSLKMLGLAKAARHAKAHAMLALVAMDDYASRLPAQLSGGQQQRVGFARALAAGPRVMLLDEPFGALDPVTRDELRDDFLQLRRRLGLTAVMVTHDMTEALLSADLIAVMNAGRLLQLGTPHELLTKPADEFVAALMATPRRQARQVESLVMAGGTA